MPTPSTISVIGIVGKNWLRIGWVKSAHTRLG